MTDIVAGPDLTELLWQNALNELKSSMTIATFNTWLNGTKPAGFDSATGTLAIAVRNSYAVDWLENRYAQDILRILDYLSDGDVVAIRFVASAPQNGTLSAACGLSAPNPTHKPLFVGFEPLRANFTQVPNRFFTDVLPGKLHVVTKLVGQVIIQTIGTFTDIKHHHRRDEWPVNTAVLSRVSGIKSRVSLARALWDARTYGYIVLRNMKEYPDEAKEMGVALGYQVTFTLRIRFEGEPVDTPESERPYSDKEK